MRFSKKRSAQGYPYFLVTISGRYRLSDSGFAQVEICDPLCLKQIKEAEMARVRPMKLPRRVAAFVEEGKAHRASAARFPVSIKSVNDTVMLKRETGGWNPVCRGNGGGHGKLAAVQGRIAARIAAMMGQRLRPSKI